jgi:hypothetical protein
MVYEVWDVVNVAAYPNQEEPSETTARPAIIIEDLQNEVLLCPVTKQIHQAQNYKYTFLVKKDSDDGKLLGFEYDSIIVLDRCVQLNKNRLCGKKGICSDYIIEQIDKILLQMKKDGVKI